MAGAVAGVKTTHTGGCLCGAVRYEVCGPPKAGTYRHIPTGAKLGRWALPSSFPRLLSTTFGWPTLKNGSVSWLE